MTGGKVSVERRIVRAVAAVAWCGGIVLAGCGLDPDDSLRSIAGTTVPGNGSMTTGTVTEMTLGDTVYPPNGDRVEVLAIDNNFMPQVVTVAAGTEVHWRNNGRNDHNVIPADDPTAASWGVLETLFAPKGEYAHVFERAGTYTYYCSIHGTATAAMFGTIVVTAP